MELNSGLSNATQAQTSLLKQMVYACFNTIAYARKLFDENEFHTCKYHTSAESCNLKQLIKGKSVQADTFLKWIEQGIFGGIDAGYVQTVQFGIYLDENIPHEFAETYIFDLDYTYGREGINGNINGYLHGSQAIGYKSFNLFYEKLLESTGSFEPLPPKRFVSIKLLFTPGSPAEYQPVDFKDCTNGFNLISFDEGCRTQFGPLVHNRNSVDLEVISNVGRVLLEDSQTIDPLRDVLNGDAEDTMVPATTIVFKELGDQETQETQAFATAPAAAATTAPATAPANTVPVAAPKVITPTVNCECGCNKPNDPVGLNKSVFPCRRCGKIVHKFCYATRYSGPSDCITCDNLTTWKPLLRFRAIMRLLNSASRPHLNNLLDLSDELNCVILKFLFETRNLILVSIMPKNSNGGYYSCVGSLTIDESVKLNFLGAEVNPRNLMLFTVASRAERWFQVTDFEDLWSLVYHNRKSAINIFLRRLEALKYDLKTQASQFSDVEDFNLPESLVALSQVPPSILPSQYQSQDPTQYQGAFPAGRKRTPDPLRFPTIETDPIESDYSQSQPFVLVENRFKRPAYDSISNNKIRKIDVH